MSYRWIIEDRLAQGPLPSRIDILELSKVFSGVVVLLSYGEIPVNYIDDLRSYGLSVLHLPTLDHHPVELLDLLRAIYFIKKHLENRKSVLVHCYGGIGRSGLVTASYLIYSGFNIYEAIRHVRSRVPGSIENQWQHLMLEDLYFFISNISRGLLERYMEIINNLFYIDPVSYYHLSKVLQFTLGILSKVVGIRLEHDYLIEISDAMIHVHRDNLRELLRKVVMQDSEQGKSIIVDLAHTIDYRCDSRVVSLLIDSEFGEVDIKLLCRDRCDDIINEIKKELYRFQGAFNKRVVFTWDYYSNYI